MFFLQFLSDHSKWDFCTVGFCPFAFLLSLECDVPVPGIFLFFGGIGTGIGKNWYRKRVSEPASEKFGTGKNYRNRYRKKINTTSLSFGSLPPNYRPPLSFPTLLLFQLCPLHSIATVSIRGNCAFVFNHCEWTNHTFWRPANCVIHHICHYFQEVFLGSL